MRVIPLAISQL